MRRRAERQLKSMRVHDLLRMSTGHQTEPSVTTTPVWTKTFLAQPVKQAGHAFRAYSGHLHVVRHPAEGDGDDRARLSEAAAL